MFLKGKQKYSWWLLCLRLALNSFEAIKKQLGGNEPHNGQILFLFHLFNTILQRSTQFFRLTSCQISETVGVNLAQCERGNELLKDTKNAQVSILRILVTF